MAAVSWVEMFEGAVVARMTESRWAAFEDTVRRESGHLFRVACSILDDAGEAEDAVQDTLLRAWRAWESVTDDQRRRAWLTRICINRSLDVRDRLRLRWPGLAAIPDEHLTVADGNTVGPAALGDPDLGRVYARLPRHQRAVLTLHYGHGYTLDECAGLLGCRPGTVRTHLSRALARFRKELGDD